MSGSLREIQELLLDALQQGESLTGSAAFAERVARVARGNDRLSPVEQVDIYREQFFLRHIECLLDDYPALEALLGHQEFVALSRAYLAAHPPTSFTLRDLGARLPEFLSRYEGYDNREVLVDMARLEWALIDAFDAADLPPLDPATLQASADAFDTAVLTFDPSLTLLDLGHPVHRVHQAASEGEEFEVPAPERTFLGVYRRLDRALDWHEIPELAYRSLGALRRGTPLAQALDEVASSLSEQGEVELLTASVGAWFADWVQRGWLRSLTFAGTP